MADAFPDPPKGSPDGVHSAAQSLRAAASELESAAGRLSSATGSLSGSWEGEAAQAYRGSADALGWCASGVAGSFRTCAAAVSGYASALEDAQSAIRRLRGQYDDAVARAAAATAAAGQLSGALAGVPKAAKPELQNQIGAAQRNAGTAAGEADSYASAAQQVLSEFKAKESRYQAELGCDPFGPISGPLLGGPIGSPGSPFGIPFGMAGAMAPFGGVLPVIIGGPNSTGLVLAGALPTGGKFPYNSGQKGGRPNKLPRGQGYLDKYGNQWQWDPKKSEWDVQHRDSSHTNVGPNGEITHKPGNFPKQPKPATSPSSGGGGPSTAEMVAGGVIVGGAAIALAPFTGGGSLLALAGL